MNSTIRKSYRHWARNWVKGSLGALCCLAGAEAVLAQQPAPLLARPAGIDSTVARPRRIGLGAPVPASAMPNATVMDGVQPASLQTDKPLPRPDEKTVTGNPPSPELLHMPAPTATGSFPVPPGQGMYPQTSIPVGPNHYGPPASYSPMLTGQPGVIAGPVVMNGQPGTCCGPILMGDGNCCPTTVCDPCASPYAGSFFGWLFSPHWGVPGCSELSAFQGFPGQQPRFRASFEYLMWKMRNDDAPPLVTSGTDTSGGILNRDGTTTLFGGALDQGYFSGGRLTLGLWFDCHENLGLEGSFFMLGQQRLTYVAGTQGLPIVARPIIAADTGQEAAIIIAAPGESEGNVMVSSSARMLGADLNLRKRWWSGSILDCPLQIDALGGFRYIRLDENLTITDDVFCTGGTNCPAGTHIARQDDFKTLNNFFGGQLGLDAELRKGPWVLNLRGKVAAGVTQQSALVNGATAFVLPDGSTVVRSGGVLALPSNMGTYNRSMFSVVPEVGVTLSYHLTESCRVFVGYNALVWTNVVRPGRQIDRVVDPGQFPSTAAPGGGGVRPMFNLTPSTFWTHGMTAGLEWRF